MRRSCKRAISIALIFCLPTPSRLAWSAPPKAVLSGAFAREALANVALDAHFTLLEKYRSNWETLRGPTRRAGDYLWVARHKTKFFLRNLIRMQAWMVSSMGLGGPFWNDTPQFVTLNENENFRVERALIATGRVYRLSDLKAGSSVLITPTHGNDVFSFKVMSHGQERELLDYHGFSEIGKGGMPILFPYAGWIGDMVFEANGKRLELKEREWVLQMNGHTIHGFVNRARWKEEEPVINEESVFLQSSIELRDCVPDQDVVRFFGNAKLTVRHRLNGNQLHSTAVVRNQSSHPISFSFAFHPYFKVPRHHWKDVRLTIPADSVWRTDDQKRPLAEPPVAVERDLDLRDGKAPVRQYDHAFTGLNYQDERGNVSAFIDDVRSGLRLVLNPRGFTHIVLYKDDGPEDGSGGSIAVEPQTSSVDAFARHADPRTREQATLVTLDPGQKWFGKFRIVAEDLPLEPEIQKRIADVWVYLNNFYKIKIVLTYFLSGEPFRPSEALALLNVLDPAGRMKENFSKLISSLVEDRAGKIAHFYKQEMRKPYYQALTDVWEAAVNLAGRITNHNAPPRSGDVQTSA
jgi:galactose mutarotase-like enzyme